MNRWTQYLGSDPGGTDDTTISLIFGQELGHAWASFVYYNQGMGWETNLLGRANAHWSFYLSTGGSPLQGHEWVDNGDGTFTALEQEIFPFSDLDLYLMGLLPPEDVAPWFVLEDPFDCFDAAAGDDECAPPQAFLFEADTYTVGATRRDVSIADVLAVEGARVPAYPDAPDEFDVSFLMIKRPEEVLTEDELAAIDTIVERSVSLFETQARGLGRVVNRTAVDSPGGDTGADETGPGDDSGTDAGEGTMGAGTQDGPGSGTAEGSGTGAEATGTGQEGGSGCSCATSSPSRPLGALWSSLMLLALGRRRCR